MIETGGNPGRGAMAVIAGIAALDVVRALAGCRAAIVAGEAAAGDIAVIEAGGHPGDGAVAFITLVAALDVVWCFTRGSPPVVTGLA